MPKWVSVDTHTDLRRSLLEFWTDSNLRYFSKRTARTCSRLINIYIVINWLAVAMFGDYRVSFVPYEWFLPIEENEDAQGRRCRLDRSCAFLLSRSSHATVNNKTALDVSNEPQCKGEERKSTANNRVIDPEDFSLAKGLREYKPDSSVYYILSLLFVRVISNGTLERCPSSNNACACTQRHVIVTCTLLIEKKIVFCHVTIWYHSSVKERKRSRDSKPQRLRHFEISKLLGFTRIPCISWFQECTKISILKKNIKSISVLMTVNIKWFEPRRLIKRYLGKQIRVLFSVLCSLIFILKKKNDYS